MRIFQLVGYLSDGGAETLVKDYALQLKRLGHEVYIVLVYPSADTANYRILHEHDIPILTIFKKHSLTHRIMFRLFKYRYARCYMEKLMNQYRPDVIHSHMQYLAFLSPFIGNCSAKLVYTCHSVPAYYFNSRKPFLFETTKALVHRNHLQLIALHKDMANELNTMFGIDNTAILNNGIDFKRFKTVKESKMAIRKSIGVPESSYVIGHVGRFSEPKNHQFILKVFREVINSNDNAHLLLIGSGPLKESMEALIEEYGIKDNVTILSNRTDIPRLLKAMDVFFLPSLFEGLSISLVEAQVSGLPCVVSDTINPASFLSDRITCLNLSLEIDLWCKSLLCPIPNVRKYGNIEDFDINNEIHKLVQVYKQ